MYQCPRCDGKGHLKEYAHIQGGTCFKCGGTGKVSSKPSNRVFGKKGSDEIAAKSQVRQAKAMELYKDDARLGVANTHPYYYMHAVELAKKDGAWETL